MKRRGGGKTRDPAALLVGTWGPADEADANVRFTVVRRGRGLAVTAVDAFDGEKLQVKGVTWNGRELRFATVTPSTGALVEHELRASSAAQAVYRFTVAQSWKKLPDDQPPGVPR